MTEQRNDELWTPANKVTFTRIILIPVFVAILLAPRPQYFPDWQLMDTLKPWLAAGVFIVLSLTDTLDGYLARSRGEVTDFGKFMDPLADKLLVAAALLGLIEMAVLPSWVALVIITREFIVSGVRMVAASKGEVIAASWYGKVKTVLQMLAIILFIVKDSRVLTDIHAALHDWLYVLSWVVMLAAIFMTVVSMVDYLYKARHMLGFGKKASRKSSKDSISSVQQAPPQQDKGLAASVLDAARDASLTIATAESCTGGLIGGALTAVPGSSDVYWGGVVSYANDVKVGLLGVEQSTLAQVGAVSEQTACEMARGARQATGAGIGLSVTGIAGPGGAEPGKPVGTVWIGVSDTSGETARRFEFSGDRKAVRAQTVEESLRILLARIQELSRQ